jgi:hypothetical protein
MDRVTSAGRSTHRPGVAPVLVGSDVCSRGPGTKEEDARRRRKLAGDGPIKAAGELDVVTTDLVDTPLRLLI